MHKTFILILLSILVFAGCNNSKKYKKYEPRDLTEIQQVGSFTSLWSKKLGPGKAAYGYKLSPEITGNQLYVASQSGEILKLDAETGSEVWKIELETEISAGPGVGDKTLVVGTPEGFAIALDKETGSQKWSVKLSSEILSPPIVYNQTAIVRTQDGRVYSLKIENGERNWLFDTNIPNLTLRGNSKPIVKAGRVFIGFDNGRVAAIQHESGNVIWSQNVVETDGKTELARIVDIDGDMALIATDLYLSSAVGKTIAVATEAGRVMWSIDSGSAAGVSASRNSLFIVDNESNVVSLNRADGSEQWKTTGFKYRGLSKPAYYLGDILVSDYEGYVHVIDGTNGTVLARTRIGKDEFYQEPIVSGNTVYSYNKDGTLKAYSYSR